MRMPVSHPAYESAMEGEEYDPDAFLDRPFRLRDDEAQGELLGEAAEQTHGDAANAGSEIRFTEDDLNALGASRIVQQEISRFFRYIQILMEKSNSQIEPAAQDPIRSFIDIAPMCTLFIDFYITDAGDERGQHLERKLEETLLLDRRHGLGIRLLFMIVFGRDYARLDFHQFVYRSRNEGLLPRIRTFGGTLSEWLRSFIAMKFRTAIIMMGTYEDYATQVLQGVNRNDWLNLPLDLHPSLEFLQQQHIIWTS